MRKITVGNQKYNVYPGSIYEIYPNQI